MRRTFALPSARLFLIRGISVGRCPEHTLKSHRRQQWVIPPKANSAFVAAIEDVLAVYTQPRDPDRPASSGKTASVRGGVPRPKPERRVTSRAVKGRLQFLLALRCILQKQHEQD